MMRTARAGDMNPNNSCDVSIPKAALILGGPRGNRKSWIASPPSSVLMTRSMPSLFGASGAWIADHALELAGSICLLVLAILAWVLLLKRQTRRHALLLQSQLARERVLAELGRALATALTVEEAARDMADAAAELFGWDAFYLNLYSMDHDLMEPVIDIDTMGGRRVDAPSGFPAGKPTPMARQIVEHGAKLLLRGRSPAEGNPALAPFGDQTHPSASLMFVPIRDRSRIIGILSVQSYTPRLYDEAKL